MNKKHVFDFIASDPIAAASSLVHDVKNFGVCSVEERNMRLQICNNCKQLKHGFCAKCACYMPLKSYIKQSVCPLNLF